MVKIKLKIKIRKIIRKFIINIQNQNRIVEVNQKKIYLRQKIMRMDSSLLRIILIDYYIIRLLFPSFYLSIKNIINFMMIFLILYKKGLLYYIIIKIIDFLNKHMLIIDSCIIATKT